MNYKQQIEDDYKDAIYYHSATGADFPLSKYHYLADRIFDFVTYDSDMDEKLAKRMLEVIECTLNKKTFEYQKEKYENYILMVNMPFLSGKLSWGMSIRGAWFNEKGFSIETAGFKINPNEVGDFFRFLLDWVLID